MHSKFGPGREYLIEVWLFKRKDRKNIDSWVFPITAEIRGGICIILNTESFKLS